MTDIRLSTCRLELRPLPAAAAAALPVRRGEAATILGATLPPAWPQPDLLDVLPMQASASPELERFGVWLMIERESNTVVGDIGFMGLPHDEAVEVGFSVIPDRRRRGYATESSRAIVDWALRQRGIRSVIARCETDNLASIGVLDRTGFVRTGEEDGLIRWRTENPEG
jgi:ribosomal-protein-alanine N-acetyltransferase